LDGVLVYFFHALGVFIFSGRSAIKEQMIEKEMKKKTLKEQFFQKNKN